MSMVTKRKVRWEYEITESESMAIGDVRVQVPPVEGSEIITCL